MTDTLLERSPLEMAAEEQDSAAEANRAATEATIASLKAVHKFVRWWEIEGFGLVAVRRMRRSEVLMFTKMSNAANKVFETSGDAAGLVDSNEKAVTTCCVWPKNREVLKEIFDQYPNFCNQAALAISQMQDEGVTEGKD